MNGYQAQAHEAREAAAAWLVRRDRGLSAAEALQFQRWLAADPLHSEAWSDAERLWASFDEPSDLQLLGLRRAALQARRPRVVPAQIAAAVAAAAVVVVAGLAGLRLRESDHQPGEAGAEDATQILEARADVRTLRMADGSQVTLDAGTAVDVAFSKTARTVRLRRGRAFFDVASDPSRRFAIVAAGRTVTDVGTAFQVELKGAAFSVILERGAVVVAQAGAAPVQLQPGQRLRATGPAAGAVDRVDVAQALDWREGWIEFRDAPLAEALQRVAESGGPAVRIGDAAAARVRVSGRFRSGDPGRFARALTQAYPLKLKSRAGVLTLVGR